MARALPWTQLSDEELLSRRFCDLKLTLDRPFVRRSLRRLGKELASRGIALRPHVWIAEEWFSPDGVPGFAVPFYLAHPRLERLERRIVREVEGGNSRWLMRILRHEAGHAVDTGYRLRRRRRWREVFGHASAPYPHRYRARPGSRRYVHHLGEWYAQSHPTEDFAETFAVWLTPRSNWRRSYADWPAFRKLHLVDALMAELRGARPVVANRTRIEPLEANTRTLAQHYRAKLARYRLYRRGFADKLLRRIFVAEPPHARAVRASSLLRHARAELVASVVREVGAERYCVQQHARTLIARSDALGLYVCGSRRHAKSRARRALVRLVRLYEQGETPHFRL